jgi:hypothetical protein
VLRRGRFRFGLPRQIAGLLLLLCYPAPSDGRAADAVALPPEGSAPEAIVSEARLSLAEARKTRSDPRTAVGHYLDAADAAVRSVGVSSANEAEARSIYNAASQKVTVLHHPAGLEHEQRESPVHRPAARPS